MKKFFTILTLAATCSASFAQTDLKEAYQQFAFRLLGGLEDYQFSINTPPEDVVISPLSAQYALSMLMNGAEGDTRDEIISTLQLGNFSLDSINRYNQQLLSSFQSTVPDYILELAELFGEDFNPESVPQLEIANSLWCDDDFELYRSYEQTLQQYFDAESYSLDLSQQSSLDQVDEWVRRKTHNQIPSFNLKPSADLKLLLLNALYFKGGWEERFFEIETTDEVFYNRGSLPVIVPMMHHWERNLRYACVDGMQAVKLYYGYDRKFSMTLFISDQTAELGSFSYEQWKNIQQNMSSDKGVNLSLPRFKAKSEFNLNHILQQLGMNQAYDRVNANFSRITPEPIYVSNVKQLGNIEVDEAGTVAAAVTIIEMPVEGIPDDVVSVNFDHPFYFTIEDNQNGTILFMGHIHEIESDREAAIDDLIDSSSNFRPIRLGSSDFYIIRDKGKARVIFSK